MKNAKTNANAIVFAQAKDSTKAVVANKYVAYALYTQNKALVEALGGEIIKGVDGFRAEFKTAKNAKAFIAQAITSISAKDYNKARKTEPKAKAEKKATVPTPTKAKGNKAVEYVTVYLADGTPLQVKASDLAPTKATTPKKAVKGKAKADKPTTAPNAKAPKSTKQAEPKKAKGNCKVDFSSLAGKGRTANKDAAALMRKAGITDGTSAEYKAVWAEWCKVR
jgi:hypothetical protein